MCCVFVLLREREREKQRLVLNKEVKMKERTFSKQMYDLGLAGI